MKISLTLTSDGQTVMVDDTDVVKFQANSSTGSLVYINTLGAQPQVLDVTESPSAVQAKSPLFISLTQVLSPFANASVTLTTSSGTFAAGETVYFAGGAANGNINTTNGSTTMTVTNLSGKTLANADAIRGVTSGAIGVVSGTPTYSYDSSQAFYLNAGRVIEYQNAGFQGLRTILVNDGFTPDGSQINVSDSLASIDTAMAGAGYVTIGGAQTITGAKTFDSILVTKADATQATSVTTTVVANGSAGTITMFTSTLAANGAVTFAFTNSAITATSVVQVSVVDYSGTFSTNGLPQVAADTRAAGSCDIVLMNAGTNALNGIVKIAYLIV